VETLERTHQYYIPLQGGNYSVIFRMLISWRRPRHATSTYVPTSGLFWGGLATALCASSSSSNSNNNNIIIIRSSAATSTQM